MIGLPLGSIMEGPRWASAVSLGGERANKFRERMFFDEEGEEEEDLWRHVPSWLAFLDWTDNIRKWQYLESIQRLFAVRQSDNIGSFFDATFCQELVRLLDDPALTLEHLLVVGHVMKGLCNLRQFQFSQSFADLGAHEKILNLFLLNPPEGSRETHFIITCQVLVLFVRDCVPEVVEVILNQFFTRVIDWTFRFESFTPQNPPQFSAVNFILSCIEYSKVMENDRLSFVFDVVNTLLQEPSLTFEILSSTEEGDTATVKVSITNVDMANAMSQAISEMISLAFAGLSEEELEQKSTEAMISAIANNKDTTYTKEVDISLVKGENNWLIVPDNDLADAITGGLVSYAENINEAFS